jgi:hypothetical protein
LLKSCPYEARPLPRRWDHGAYGYRQTAAYHSRMSAFRTAHTSTRGDGAIEGVSAIAIKDAPAELDPGQALVTESRPSLNGSVAEPKVLRLRGRSDPASPTTVSPLRAMASGSTTRPSSSLWKASTPLTWSFMVCPSGFEPETCGLRVRCRRVDQVGSGAFTSSCIQRRVHQVPVFPARIPDIVGWIVGCVHGVHAVKRQMEGRVTRASPDQPAWSVKPRVRCRAGWSGVAPETGSTGRCSERAFYAVSDPLVSLPELPRIAAVREFDIRESPNRVRRSCAGPSLRRGQPGWRRRGPWACPRTYPSNERCGRRQTSKGR